MGAVSLPVKHTVTTLSELVLLPVQWSTDHNFVGAHSQTAMHPKSLSPCPCLTLSLLSLVVSAPQGGSFLPCKYPPILLQHVTPCKNHLTHANILNQDPPVVRASCILAAPHIAVTQFNSITKILLDQVHTMQFNSIQLENYCWTKCQICTSCFKAKNFLRCAKSLASINMYNVMAQVCLNIIFCFSYFAPVNVSLLPMFPKSIKPILNKMDVKSCD